MSETSLTGEPGRRPARRGAAGGGILSAVGAALLFGAAVPAAKQFTAGVSPTLAAGLLYGGAAIGLALALFARRARVIMASLARRDLPWLTGAVVMGGVLAPTCLMWGLGRTPASTASLLLNLEPALTVLIAALVFREPVGGRLVGGLSLTLAGCVLIAWTPGDPVALPKASLAVAGACLFWAIDSNLMGQIGADPMLVAGIKCAAAGGFNLVLGGAAGGALPGAKAACAVLVTGFLGYGVSLCLFVAALQAIGTARTAAWFALAPFVGAVLSVGFLGEPLRAALLGAAALMMCGAWLLLGDRHPHGGERTA